MLKTKIRQSHLIVLLIAWGAFLPFLAVPQAIQWISLPVAMLLFLVVAPTKRLPFPLEGAFLFVFLLWMYFRIPAGYEFSPRWVAMLGGCGAFYLAIIQGQLARPTAMLWSVPWIGLNLAYFWGVFSHRLNVLYAYIPFNQENDLQFWNLFFLLCAAYYRQEERSLPLVLKVATGISILSVMLSSAMAVQIAFVVGLVTYLVAKYSQGRYLQIALGLILLMCLVVPVVSAEYKDPIPGNSSYSSRQDIWDASLQMGLAHLWTGVGSGAYGGNISTYWPDAADRRYKNEVYPSCAHNWFINVFSETGLVGLLLLLASMVMSLRAIARGLSQGDKRAPVLTAFLAVVFIVNSITEVNQVFPSPFLASLGVLLWPIVLWPACTISIRANYLRLTQLLLALLISWSVYLAAKEMYAEYLTKDVFLSRAIKSESNLKSLSDALEWAPNSTAYYYLSRVYIATEQLARANEMIEGLVLTSGQRWPVDKLRALVAFQKGDCQNAMFFHSHSIRTGVLAEDPDLEKIATACAERPHPSSNSKSKEHQ